MEERRFCYAEFMVGALFGFLGGLAVGILTAPQAGIQTRRDIAEIAADVKDSTNELIEHTREGLDHATSRIERAIGISDRTIRKRLEEIRTQLDGYTPSETTT